MVSVSARYKAAIRDPDRRMAVKMTVATGETEMTPGGEREVTLALTGQDILEGSLQVKYGVIGGKDLAPGGAVMSELSVSLINRDGSLDDVSLNGAECRPFVGVKVTDTPEENEGDADFEWVPLGVFRLDAVERKVTLPGRPYRAIAVSGGDRMARFDRPFAEMGIAFPITAGNLLTLVCQKCHVPLVTHDFPNRDYRIDAVPEGNLTGRDIVANVAELAGCWARCSREGNLELSWFENPGCVTETDMDGRRFGEESDRASGGDFVDWANAPRDGGMLRYAEPDGVLDDRDRHDFEMEDAPITITGVTMDTEAGALLAGTARYAVVVDNPLIQADAEGVLAGLYERVRGMTYLPFKSRRRDDPAVEAGDLVLHTNVFGRDYRTVITEYTYAYGSPSTMAASGESETAHGYGTPMEKKYSRLLRKVGEKQEQLDAMDDAVIKGTQMLANALGGSVINGEAIGKPGEVFIAADKDNLQTGEVWVYNTEGWGYSPTGIGGPFTMGATKDNSMWANLITANMIRTGRLESTHGESWLDLHSGAFSLGNGSLAFNGNYFESINANLITTGELHSKYWESWINLEDGTFSFGYGKLKLESDGNVYLNGSLGSNGTLVNIGSTTDGYNNAFKVTASNNELFSVYSVVSGHENGVVWTAPYLTNQPNTNRKGISILPNRVMLFGDYNRSPMGYEINTQTGEANIYAKTINLFADDEVYSSKYVVVSDRALKSGIKKRRFKAIDGIKKLNFYQYDVKMSTENSHATHTALGIMADEAPDDIRSTNGSGIDLYQYCNYLAKAVQELTAEIELLKAGSSQ